MAFQVSSHAASMLRLLLRVGPYVVSDGSSACAGARGDCVWMCLFLANAVRMAVRSEALCESTKSIRELADGLSRTVSYTEQTYRELCEQKEFSCENSALLLLLQSRGVRMGWREHG